MSIRQKLLLITDMYPDAENPVNGIFVKHQVQELYRFYDVTVFASYFPAKFHYSFSCGDIDEHRVYFPVASKAFVLASISYRLWVLPKLREVIRLYSPDLIHVHDCRHFPELSILSPFLAKTGIPHYLSVHNNRTLGSTSAYKPLSLFYKAKLRSAYRGWKHIFCINRQLQKMVEPYTGKHGSSVIGNAIGTFTATHHPAIDKVKAFLQDSSFRIISAGNLKKPKGFDLLLQALVQIPNPLLRLVIVGEGEYREELSAIVHKNSLEDRVLLIGRLSNPVLRSLYSLFDAFILPSYSESFGIVYLEAMDAGLPVAGVKGQGIDAVISHNETGILMEPHSVEDIVLCINSFMEDRQRAIAIGKAGKELVQNNYRLEQLIQKMIGVYETL